MDKLCDKLFEKLIKDTSVKGKLFNDLITILNDEPVTSIKNHDEWEAKIYSQLILIKSMVTIDE